MQVTYRTIGLLVFAAGLSTCGGSGGSSGMGFAPGSGATFAVAGSIPAAGAADVALTTQIQVRFEQPVQPASVTDTSFSLWSGTRVAGDVSVAGDTVTFTPHAVLDLAAEHSLRLTSAIRSTAGEQLAAGLEIPFRTRDGVWSPPEELPADAILADLGATADGEVLALRLEASSPWSDLGVSRLVSTAPGTQGTPGAEWEPDAQLFGDGSVAFARLAVDEAGWSVVAANRSLGGNTFATWAALRDADGEWGAPVEVAPLDSGFGDPVLEITEPGRALLVWRRNATAEVWARTVTDPAAAGGGWSPALRLSNEGASADEPAVACDGAGRAIVVWREDGRFVRAARLDGDAWSPSELVHDAFLCCVSDPTPAMAPGLAPAIAWRGDGLLFVTRFQEDTATWPAANIVNGAGCGVPVEAPRIALSPAGLAFAIWTCSGSLWCNAALPGESWGAPSPIDATGVVSDSALALDANGNATLLWVRRSSPVEPSRLLCRRYAAESGWSPEWTLSDSDLCAVAPHVTPLEGGGLHAGWTITVGCDFSQGTGSRAAAFR